MSNAPSPEPGSATDDSTSESSTAVSWLPDPPAGHEEAPHYYALGWKEETARRRLKEFYDATIGKHKSTVPQSLTECAHLALQTIERLIGHRLYYFATQPESELSSQGISEVNEPYPLLRSDEEVDEQGGSYEEESKMNRPTIRILALTFTAPEYDGLPSQAAYDWLCGIFGGEPQWFRDSKTKMMFYCMLDAY